LFISRFKGCLKDGTWKSGDFVVSREHLAADNERHLFLAFHMKKLGRRAVKTWLLIIVENGGQTSLPREHVQIFFFIALSPPILHKPPLSLQIYKPINFW
jgi:hypothetical protein